MGKDADIDTKKLKNKDMKNGKIYLTLDWRDIVIAK